MRNRLLILSITLAFIYASSSTVLVFQKAEAQEDSEIKTYSSHTEAFGCDEDIFIAEGKKIIYSGHDKDSRVMVTCANDGVNCESCGSDVRLGFTQYGEWKSVAIRCDHDDWLSPARSHTMRDGHYVIVECLWGNTPGHTHHK